MLIYWQSKFPHEKNWLVVKYDDSDANDLGKLDNLIHRLLEIGYQVNRDIRPAAVQENVKWAVFWQDTPIGHPDYHTKVSGQKLSCVSWTSPAACL